MAESTLSLARADLRKAVSKAKGYSTTWTDLTTDEQTEVTDIIKEGFRKFLYPPPVNPNGQSWERESWEWSFLTPITTLEVYPDVALDSDVTCSGVKDNGTSTITASEDSFYSNMVGKSIVITGVGTFVIASYTSATVIVVTGDASGASGATFSIDVDATFDCPDNFGALAGPMTFEPDESWRDVVTVGEGQIRSKRQSGETNGKPKFVAVRPKVGNVPDASEGQRFEFIFYPWPDQYYLLTYPMTLLPDALSDTMTYPYGGMAHARTIRLACLAVCEEDDETEGVYEKRFKEALRQSISYDMRFGKGDFHGYNRDESDGMDAIEISRVTRVTYEDVYYDGT